MFDVKDTDFFDLEDEAFDTIVEDDISFTGNIKIKKTFTSYKISKKDGKIDEVSEKVSDDDSSSSLHAAVVCN